MRVKCCIFVIAIQKKKCFVCFFVENGFTAFPFISMEISHDMRKMYFQICIQIIIPNYYFFPSIDNLEKNIFRML